MGRRNRFDLIDRPRIRTLIPCNLAVVIQYVRAAGVADTSSDNDGADVKGDPETGGACTSSFSTCFDGTGGLDQNIYSATITP